MRGRLARFLFVIILGTVAMVLGVVTSMTLTPPGRALLARTVSTTLDRIVHGQVEVGSISGSFLYDLVIEKLVVRDTNGTLLADLPLVRASYRLPNLLAGQIVLSSLYLERPTIQLIKYRSGRMNYEEVLGLGKGPPGGKSPLVEFHRVRTDSGSLSIITPWNPPQTALTPAAQDSALRAERAKPGRQIVESEDGLRKVITLADLSTRMSRLRIVTPDRKPFTIDLDSLSTRVNDPGVTITDAAGRVRIRGDSAVFSLEHGALPDTRFSGGGAVTWPADTVLFDFQVVAPRVNLADLRWVSPDFPDMTGSGLLAARSENGQRTNYDIRELRLQGPLGAVEGNLIAITDRKRGIGVRDMDVRVRDFDLDVARPYVDTLPFYGTITGTAAGTGFLDALDLTVDWAYADAEVPDQPISTIVGAGRVGSRKEGLTFTQFEVRQSDIDLRTVRRLAPAVILHGRLAAMGLLDGPLHDATFRGQAVHQDGDLPASRAEGTVRLDTRGTVLAMQTDVVFDSLVFDGIRPAFPSLTARGGLRGRFVSDGTLERLAVDALLSGELGIVDARGFVTLQPPKWGADSLLLRFQRLDLAALTGRERLPTSLNGEMRVTGSIDTLRAPEGDVQVALSPSLARDATVDTVFAIVGVHDSVLEVDTAYAAMRGVRAAGSGTLGWAAPHSGTMRFGLAADSLIAFDTLLLATLEQQRDTAPDARPLGGSAQGALQLAGSLDSLLVDGEGIIEHLEWQRYRAPRVSGAFAWTGGRRPHVVAGVKVDSIAMGTWAFRQATVQTKGWADSLDWHAGIGFGAGNQINAGGTWWQTTAASILTFDSLRARLPAHTYRLEERASLTLSDSAPTLSPLTLAAADGSATVRAAGRLPGTAPGALKLNLLGFSLRDLYGLLQRDTAGVDGEIGLDLAIGGTATAPTFRGTGQLGSARFGDFRPPFVESTIDYADRKLATTLVLWRTGERVLDVDARLPIDLAFRGAKRRQLDGPIAVRARADSVDLGILEAATPAIRDVRGRLSGNVAIGGTWQKPQLSGGFAVRDGALSIPNLGVRFDSIVGSADLRGDSVALRDVRLTSGGGNLRVGGLVRLENLSRPILDLDFAAERFLAMNVRNFGTLTASTQALHLRGPIYGATLTGELTANSGVLYFADLVNKRVIDLEDPTLADLIDTTLIRREKLGAGFESRFLDSLRIKDLQMQLGSDVWLRSAEANIQLDGTVRVSKVAREYTPSGVVRALRGGYTLKIGPVTRDFSVQEGTVRYEGNLNAGLDITATHVVRTARDEEIPVTAHIAGQLYSPKLTLESVIRPPISETDLVSYLITGRAAGEAVQFGQAGALQTGLAYFSSAFSSEIERALIQDLGVPIDLLEIRPGVSAGTVGPTLTQLAAGWQIGRKTFFTVNAGFCPENLSQLSYENLGATLEFRFSREWRLQTSIEPTVQSCGPPNAFTPFVTTSQFGTDIFWEREF